MSAIDMVQYELKLSLQASFTVRTKAQMLHVMSAGAKSVATLMTPASHESWLRQATSAVGAAAMLSIEKAGMLFFTGLASLGARAPSAHT